jgi:hypothetical protein
MDWRAVIQQAVTEHGGLVTRQQLLGAVPKKVLDGYVGRQVLDRVFPHVYRLAGPALDDHTRLRAALLSVGPVGALSHTTALTLHGVRPLDAVVHVTVDQSVKRAGSPTLVVHRRSSFVPGPPQCELVSRLLVTPLARAVVDAWPLLPPADRRPMLVDLARDGRVTVDEVQDALTQRPNVGGHRSLAQTLDLVAAGCESELEVLGLLHVFRHRSLPPGVSQYKVRLRGREIRLDRAWLEVKLAVELDGRRHHTSPEDRQRDLSRDAELAALGWLVLRFTYAEVRRDPEGVRRKVREAYRARAAQLRVG